MGPRSFDRGNWTTLRDDGAAVDKASMGPRSFDRGNRRRAGGRTKYRNASMGPRSFDRGNRSRLETDNNPALASMGPRSFDRGNRLRWLLTCSLTTASMGPRSFDRGNDGQGLVDRAEKMASMGPRSFDRGNGYYKWRRGCSLERFNGAAVFRPRKCAADALERIALHPELQWGRGLSTAEMAAPPTRNAFASRSLQWGRGLSTAEIPLEWHNRGLGAIASMGPRSFDRGNVRSLSSTECSREASMGPRSFDRGNYRPATDLAGQLALQWGRGLSTAEMPTTIDSSRGVYDASMGPRSFDRGNQFA